MNQSLQKTKKNNKVWYSPKLHSLKYKKERAYKKIIRTRNACDENKYKSLKKHYFKTLEDTRIKFHVNLFQKHIKDSKATWALINKLLGRKNKNTLCKKLIINDIEITDPKDIADTFNEHFSSIAGKLHDSLPVPNYDHTHYTKREPINETIFLSPTDSQEIEKIIRNLKSKNSCSLDGITTKMIKCFPIKLICIISFLINRSLYEGIFPDTYKHTKVLSVPKKGGKHTDINQYQPISLLPSISKIFEKVVSKRLTSFLTKHKVLHPNQFGFRKNHSTNDAASYFINQIAKNIDKGLYTLGIFCDLSKAFDCLHTSTLLKKLRRYGIRGTALKWFETYLINRSQIVEVNGERSRFFKYLYNGTHQGSILGPLLFIIYINDMHFCFKNGAPVFFADDTNVLIAHLNFNTLMKMGNEELKNLNDWLITNKLTLNSKKKQKS